MQALAPLNPCLDDDDNYSSSSRSDADKETVMETIRLFSAKPLAVRRDTVFMKPVVLPQELDLHAGTVTRSSLYAGTGTLTPSLQVMVLSCSAVTNSIRVPTTLAAPSLTFCS